MLFLWAVNADFIFTICQLMSAYVVLVVRNICDCFVDFSFSYYPPSGNFPKQTPRQFLLDSPKEFWPDIFPLKQFLHDASCEESFITALLFLSMYCAIFTWLPICFWKFIVSYIWGHWLIFAIVNAAFMTYLQTSLNALLNVCLLGNRNTRSIWHLTFVSLITDALWSILHEVSTIFMPWSSWFFMHIGRVWLLGLAVSLFVLLRCYFCFIFIIRMLQYCRTYCCVFWARFSQVLKSPKIHLEL